MKTCLCVTGLTVLSSLFATPALADGCPNLLGNWNVTAQSAAYEAGPPVTTAYVSSVGVLTIYNQLNCLFLAVFQRTDVAEPPQQLTGAIGPSSEITLTGYSTLARGNLIGRSRIDVVVSDFAPGGGTINTSRGVAVRE